MSNDHWLKNKPDWMRGFFVSTMVGQDKPVVAILTVGGTWHLGMGEIPTEAQRYAQEEILGFKWTVLDEETEVCGPIPDLQPMWDSLDEQKRKKEALDALKRKWNEGWELVHEFLDYF